MSTAERGVGSTGEVEVAHEALDRLGIPIGNLAERTLTMVGRAVVKWPNTETVLRSMFALNDRLIELVGEANEGSSRSLRQVAAWRRLARRAHVLALVFFAAWVPVFLLGYFVGRG